MAILRVDPDSEHAFVEAPEVRSDLHLAIRGKRCGLVVGCRVFVDFDEHLISELENFYDSTWAKEPSVSAEDDQAIIRRYEQWMTSLEMIQEIRPLPADFHTLATFIASTYPPPPPGWPGLVPFTPPLAPPPPSVYGHLPFKSKTRPGDQFYRFEAWPTSRKLLRGPPPQISSGTYASPPSELPFLPTGFAAVARNALPSLFPAVFRHVLHPLSPRDIRCGAVIPNYGQSGGGVEVFFPRTIKNRRSFSPPVIVPPL